MDAAVAIRLLGPMELQLRGAPLPAGGPTQRAVLAMLALHIDEPVSVDELIAEAREFGPSYEIP